MRAQGVLVLAVKLMLCDDVITLFIVLHYVILLRHSDSRHWRVVVLLCDVIIRCGNTHSHKRAHTLTHTHTHTHSSQLLTTLSNTTKLTPLPHQGI
jgi:hypothetical protein